MSVPAPRPRAAIAAVLAAMALVVLGAAVANLALPTLARSLHATSGDAVWIVTAYQLSLVMALLPTAALGENLGHRRVFIAGVVLFTAASGACALAPSLPWLIAARFLQGFGGAAVMALGVALLRQVVAPDRLGAAIGWNALTVALATAAGPGLGALTLAWAPWPWLFALNLPLGAGAAALAIAALPRKAGTGRPADLVSMGLNACVFSAFVLGAGVLPGRPAVCVLLLATSAVALLALVRREAPKPAPLIPLDLLGGGSFRVSVAASILCFTGQTAGLIALPFHLQTALGMDVFTAGLHLTAWPLATAAAAPLAGRLADRLPSAWLCLLGGSALAAGLAVLAAWPPAAGGSPVLAALLLSGLGFGVFQVSNNRNMFLSAPRERSGAAGGLQGTARLTGQTLGALAMSLLFAIAPEGLAPRIGMGAGAALVLLAGLASLLRAGPAPARPVLA